MTRKIDRIHVFVLGIAVIAAAVAAIYLSDTPSEKGVTLTPKQYIELVEEKKRLRLEKARQEQLKIEQETEKR